MRYQCLDIRKIREFETKSSIKSVMIDGVLPLTCIFCKFTTCIEFDLDLHLYEDHRMELLGLPIGKGSFDFRIKYAIDEGRKVCEALHVLDGKGRRHSTT